ncbi:50S ribosomal protein L29 [Candidatus Microgenomates bacterium]|nr:50S ribosomal protein L29 [Candidatus Microgenomates bacterium]MBI2622174.1 50S ribosomal protein L29 [Candidatus Microgenomates bacterium]
MKNNKKQFNLKTKEELMVELREISDKLLKARLDKAQNKLKNTRLLRVTKDVVARIKTAIRMLEEKNNA